MKITEYNIGDLKPYDRNPRNNVAAIDYVANSIRDFGFKVPIVIDKNCVIVAGHTRYEASKRLGLEKVPCIVADDLTDDQIRAFRLADNKVAEKAEWDYDLLQDEMDALPEYNFEDFGFEFEEDEDEDDVYLDDEFQDKKSKREKENERVRTCDTYNLGNFDPSRCEGKYQMPTLSGYDGEVPERFQGFNYAMTSEAYETGIHFYIDDYQFERTWNNPERYLDIIAQFAAAFTPDFSLYREMPMAMKIWNVYRSRLIGQMMEDYGINVIPTVSWCEEETLDWCFDGLPENSTLSISTIGIKTNEECWGLFKAGLDALIEKKKPKRLVVYGGKVDYDYGDIEVIYVSNEVTERMKNIIR